MIIHYICNRNNNAGNAVRVEVAVHIFSKTDKTDTHLHKQVINQTSRITVIPGKTGKVFYHNTVDFPAHYIGQEPLEIFAVGIRPCVSIVHIFGNAFKFLNVLLIKVIQQVALVFNAVAIVFSFFQIFFGKPDIFAQPPAPDRIRGRETLLKPSVFCS